jgi:hypothetical protein
MQVVHFTCTVASPTVMVPNLLQVCFVGMGKA